MGFLYIPKLSTSHSIEKEFNIFNDTYCPHLVIHQYDGKKIQKRHKGINNHNSYERLFQTQNKKHSDNTLRSTITFAHV